MKHTKKFIVLLLSVMVLLPSFITEVKAAGTEYYVDAVNGNDSNNGQSESNAWQSLEHVSSQTFQSGDRIRFKCGDVFTGELSPGGSGESSNPIIMDSYGSGSKPIIQANGNSNSAIYLKNQSYWEINNLEITNQASTWGDFRGISINGDDYGVINHIYIRNCYIHDVKGEVNWIGGSSAGSDGINFGTGWDSSKRTGGIVFETQATGSTHVKTTFNDVLIENCVLEDNSFSSIIFKQVDNGTGYGIRNSENDSNWAPHTNIRIKGNYIDHTGSSHACNGMYITDVKGAVIENNVVKGAGTSAIELYYADDCVIQYNETFDTVKKCGGADSNGIDPDKGTTNIIVQYNYVHGNGDGILLCQIGFGGDCIIRYNILQNNSRLALNLHSSKNSYAEIYNNTIYTSMSNSELVYSSGGQSYLDNKGTYVLKNNIFYTSVTNPKVGEGSKTTYSHNVYYGASAPTDSNAITSNPRLMSPGSGQDGGINGPAFDSLSGYKLYANSPCINAGTSIWNGGKDFFGTNLYNGSSDIGAYEATGNEEESLFEGVYVIRNQVHNKCLDAQPNNVVILENASSYQDQQWEIINAGSGYYYIKSMSDNRYYLDSDGDYNVIWNDGYQGDDAKWSFESVGDNAYRINNKKTGRDYLVGTSTGSIQWNTGDQSDETVWLLEYAQ